MRTLLRIAALAQLARIGVQRRRRRVVLKRQRRHRAVALALLGAAGAWLLLRRGAVQTPAWVRKKQRREARRAEAQRRAAQAPERPPQVHVEANAATGLKVPLGERSR